MRPAGCSESIRDRSQTHQHTVAVIPARYASTRFPGKALADIGGRPMIEHVYRRAAAARHVDAVIVATDDARIVDAVRRFGGDVRMTRASHATGTDRIAEVAATLDCDLIVNVQGDEPLIEPAAIDEAIEPFRDDPALVDDVTLPAPSRNPKTRSIRTSSRSSSIAAGSRSISRARRFPSVASAAAGIIARALSNISACTSSGVSFC